MATGYSTDDGLLRKGHELCVLWEKAAPVLRDHVSGMRHEELEAVSKQIAELQETDPKADGFRYPKTRETKISQCESPLPIYSMSTCVICVT